MNTYIVINRNDSGRLVAALGWAGNAKDAIKKRQKALGASQVVAVAGPIAGERGQFLAKVVPASGFSLDPETYEL